MIGAGVLALPTVAAPAGFLPSSAALIGVWVYMVATGLLISGTWHDISLHPIRCNQIFFLPVFFNHTVVLVSNLAEVSINTACSLGRPSGVSLLSLGQLTLGKTGAIVTAASYTLLHYAILTAYTSQGGAMLNQLFQMLESTLGIPVSHLSPIIPAAIFASTVGGCMYALPGRAVQNINNILVVGVLTTFLSILGGAGAHLNATHLLDGTHWQALGHGEIVPVLFVSCVYHNIVSTITMRLEGDRRKIRRVIVGGSAVPLLMFLLYDAVMLGNNGASNAAQLGVAAFSLLAITTSFIGFVEGLTELWTDVRLSALKESQRQVARSTHVNFLATIVPPFVFTAVSPDIFLRALDAAGTYGIAVLFGALPAAMAWRNRRAQRTAGFRRLVGGGDALLAAVAVVPVLLIGSRIAETVGIL